MNDKIRSDFASFITNSTLFSSDVKLYPSVSGDLVFEGKGIYDKKPNLIEDAGGNIGYSGNKSVLTLSMSDLSFMANYFSLKGYYAIITDNNSAKNYNIIDSNYNSNVDAILCYLKEA